MTAYLCPIFQEPQFTDNDEFLAGGRLWFYEAGTSSLATAYTTDVGDIAWSNPIVLNSRGETGGTIWLAQGVAYRIVLEDKPAYGQTHGAVITEHDDITGINDVTSTLSQSDWVTFAGSPNYISTTSFSVAGDYRSTFVENRKLRLTDSGGVSVHSVTSYSYLAGVTTVNITGLIDNGISLVEYSFITPDASPDRFENVTVTNDLTVSGDTVIDGNVAIGGTASVGGSTVWTNANNLSSVSANGYQKLNSGIIIQWGTATTNGLGTAVVAYPTSFTTATYSVTTNIIHNTALVTTSSPPTTTGFSAYIYNLSGVSVQDIPIRWIAIGK